MDQESRSSPPAHPALQAFLDQLSEQPLIGQVLLQSQDAHWEMRHVQDRDQSASALRTVQFNQLRNLAQSTASGAFRPLKSAPNLVAGWRTVVVSPQQLTTALDQLYPGFLADWYADRTSFSAVTHFRVYAGRQSGMYRIVDLLTDAQAGRVIQTACAPRFCLKHRRWTSPGLAADAPDSKSIIPCLEPCAVFMEFARKAVRLEQAESAPVQMSSEEWESVEAALERSIAEPDPNIREADFASPLNPRRLHWALEKVRNREERN